MIYEKKMYTVICDNCGVDANEDSDYSCWGTQYDAVMIAEEGDWIDNEGKNYCPDCYDYGDDDEIIIDESRKGKYPSLLEQVFPNAQPST